MTVGFIGLGTMGLPMARRLLAAGTSLMVWNRSAAKCAELIADGATCAASVDEVFARCEVVLLMLLDARAVDAVLERGSPAFASRVRDRTVVTLGTTSPAYSAALCAEIERHGGAYVEAPVSGSRGPAEQGALVGMLAGKPDDVARVEPLLAPLCKAVFRCGAVPAALQMKLAVNHYLIVIVTALAESFAIAQARGIDLALFQRVLDAGPMASDVSRGKLDKMLRRDFSAQAGIRDVAQIARLVRAEARAAGVDAGLIEIAAQRFESADARGLSDRDMCAVLQPTHPLETTSCANARS